MNDSTPLKGTWNHVFHPQPNRAAPTLLLLHGTGGNEHDLVPLARSLCPEANLLSPRGPVLENGMPRFFRRLAEGVFDLEDLHRRTDELNTFIDAAVAHYGVERDRLFAVGFSNGANIAASLLLSGHRLGGALLLRVMTPFTPASVARLGLPAMPVRIQSGKDDPIVSSDDPTRLATLLRSAEATVEHTFYEAGHGLSQADLDDAQGWLERVTV